MIQFNILIRIAIFALFFNAGYGQKKEIVLLEKAVESLRMAMVDPSEASLKALTMEALTYGHSGGKVEDQASFISNLMNGNSDFLDITLSNQTIEIYKKTAIVRHQLYAKTNDKGKSPGEVTLKIMTVWVKSGGRWKMFGRQAIKSN